jgi:uridine phosphorylase
MHLCFDPQQVANHLGIDWGIIPCILSGDPGRTLLLAEKMQAKVSHSTMHCLNQSRGLHVYLVQTQNKHILFATSGMGSGSASVVINELAMMGIKKIIRFGSCGSLQTTAPMGTLVLSKAALCFQQGANDVAPVEYPCVSDPFVLHDLYTNSVKHNAPIVVGLTASVDNFYEGQCRADSGFSSYVSPQAQHRWEMFESLGVTNVEMEVATVLKLCSVYGIQGAALCIVVAERWQSSSVFKHTYLDAMYDTAIDIFHDTFL